MENEDKRQEVPAQDGANTLSEEELLAALELFSDSGERKTPKTAADKPAVRKRSPAKPKAETKPKMETKPKTEKPLTENTAGESKLQPESGLKNQPPKQDAVEQAPVDAQAESEAPETKDVDAHTEPAAPRKQRQNRKRRRRKGFLFGLFIIALACVGAWSLASDAVGYVKSVIRNDEQIKIYNTFLAPVVENDPDTFDDISKANMNQLLDISVRALLGDGLAPDKYPYTDGSLVIPQADVEAYFIKYFGTAVIPAHANVTGYGYEFIYNADAHTYSVPVTGVTPLYYASVTNTQKKGDAAILTVAYMATEEYGRVENGVPVPAEPDKYMKITIRKSGSSYVITAIQNV
ncbi:MAG: hypothetical protein GX051_08440 [Clostridiales bacterium]|nr:hypothetical protein [Clostridiales bacterium]